MEAYKIFQQQRSIRQFFMGLGFIVIIVTGWYLPLLGFFIPLCMLFGIGMGVIRGRKWCDWYCPRGSFYDALIGRLSPQKDIPPALRSLLFRVGFLVVLMLILAVNLVIRWPNPYRMGMFFMVLLTITTTLGIILAVIFNSRTWCMVCPIGTMIKLTSRNKKPLKINSSSCAECKLCAKVCPVQIKPYSFKGKGLETVKDKDCLQCGSCVAVCPEKSLSL